MGIFKKKKKEVDRELPELPQIPEMPSMPSFPELPKKEEFEEKMSELPELPSIQIPPPLRGAEQFKIPSRPMTMEISEEETEMEKLKEPIFVKIDKYREAVANLEMIKKKLQETSSLLEKIKETRAKEEEELDLWTQEINAIKEKIETVDKKLFRGV